MPYFRLVWIAGKGAQQLVPDWLGDRYECWAFLVMSCVYQVIWKIPEELRAEQAGLGSIATLRLLSLYVKCRIYFVSEIARISNFGFQDGEG
jgi:hypothetical protein